MRGCEVGNMDVVALARTVRGGIIRPENLEWWSGSQQSIDSQGNQMSLGVVSLGQVADAVGPGSIEIAENSEMKLICGCHILDNLFAEILRTTVGTDGTLRRLFRDW